MPVEDKLKKNILIKNFYLDVEVHFVVNIDILKLMHVHLIIKLKESI